MGDKGKAALRSCDDDDLIVKLQGLLPEGSTIHWTVKSVSRGNASSVIDFFAFYFEPCTECMGRGRRDHFAVCQSCNGRRGEIRHHWLSRMIANAGLGRFDAKHEGIRVGGHGHNRAGHVVWALARALYGRNDALRMERL